ncbi:ORF_27 [Adoxophyes orana granulovirus]|uniref:ADOR27 n=1 Tax=Adoxophyes orana granulovirus TaxID=170617 RepID=Q7T9Y8_GVAO|nr:ORF_27 [Adoxophyes orana granulovirus]AAP85664.1 ORF_27 [Adoxophyes orana granulovirus]AJA91667.1 ADOR27 [Adoxophyes orana granulovirus]
MRCNCRILLEKEKVKNYKLKNKLTIYKDYINYMHAALKSSFVESENLKKKIMEENAAFFNKCNKNLDEDNEENVYENETNINDDFSSEEQETLREKLEPLIDAINLVERNNALDINFLDIEEVELEELNFYDLQ